MIDFSLPTIIKYLTAFAIGFVGALIPQLYAGLLPTGPQLIVAVAAGLTASGLFHAVPPRAEDPMKLSQQPPVAAGTLPDATKVIAVPKP